MKNKKWMFLFIIMLIVFIWIAWGNTALEVNKYQIISEKLPQSFHGFRIAHVSDLHNTEIGEGNFKLLDMLEKAEPDIIVMTGDMIDSYHTDMDVFLRFAEKVVKIAPCYYVTGNHEARLPREMYLNFEEKIEDYGIEVIHDETILIEKDDEYISLAGLDDPSFVSRYGDIQNSNLLNRIQKLFEEGGYQILLSHRPELFQIYVDAEVDLVFSGHAHGGQFRIPFVGGVVAPNQGFFPEYDAGLFVEDKTNMIVSRGIGNSIFPVRLNNRPEVVVVELSR